MSTKQRRYRKKSATDDDHDTASPSPAQDFAAASLDPAEEGKDESAIVREALELRKFRRRQAGIDTTDLLKGEKKKRKDKPEDDDPWKLKSGGGLVDIANVKGRQFNADGTSSSSAFATESNAMDTQRLMDDFIEKELRKRKGIDPSAEAEDSKAATRSTDYRDQLFEIPEHLRTQSKPVSEGNVTLSTSMLTAIPEVDLGIDIKLRNIEETERAKRRMQEAKNAPDRDPVIVAAERFQTNTRRRTELVHGPGSPSRPPRNQPASPPTSPQRTFVTGGPFAGPDADKKKFDKKTMATDEMVMERFRKRLRKH
ncbi:hypothetical protein HK097_004874 [Rhizophlyctis rosea]|uniref:Hepatocellular carcinoma-associated antigen 59-domain-containing protein n=1 Tax=Rhizophlyctis rosea TaxID=64517 RepID=A0AAD5SR46_9FUNG|nr:hypothetical protein HK097_004874 [Rhizophlyctis rosea]